MGNLLGLRRWAQIGSVPSGLARKAQTPNAPSSCEAPRGLDASKINNPSLLGFVPGEGGQDILGRELINAPMANLPESALEA